MVFVKVANSLAFISFKYHAINMAPTNPRRKLEVIINVVTIASIPINNMANAQTDLCDIDVIERHTFIQKYYSCIRVRFLQQVLFTFL